MVRLLKILFALAIAASSSVAFGASPLQNASFGSVSVQSERHDAAQLQEFAREAQSLMDSHAAFLRSQGFEIAARPLTLQLLSSHDEYETFKAQSQVRSESPRGYYEHNSGRIVTWEVMSSGISSELERILTHETFHHQLHGLVGDAIPLWLDEGLAVLFEASPSVGGAAMNTASVSAPALAKVKASLGTSQEITLEKLLTMDRASFYGPDAALNYATAWSFVHFLTNDSTQKSRQTLAEVLKAAKQGGDVHAVLLQLNGNNPEGLQAAWRAHLAKI